MHHRAASYNRRLLFYTLYLAYIGGGIMSILPGPTLSLLANNTHVSTAVAGWIFTAGAGGFALGVLLTGALAGKVRPKTILMAGLSLMAIASMIIPLTSQFPVLLATALCKGIGFGALDVSINILMTLAFHDSLGESFNSLHSSYGVGALVAPVLLSLTLTMMRDARWAYFTGAILAFICVVMLARQTAPSTAALPAKSAQQARTGTVSARQIFRQPLLWLMAFEFFFYIIAEIGFSNWIVTAISQTAVISLALAAPFATAFWTGLTLSRIVGGQVLRRTSLSENQLLFVCIIGGCLSCLLVAIFPGQLLISFSASACAGFFFGPIYPGLMAIAARWYIHAPDTLSGVMLFSCGISGMIFPVLMGLFVPIIGFNWVMTVPALGCLLILVPFILAIANQRRALQLPRAESTIESTLPLTTHEYH
jgi:FHS family glucose/mannose:H+ symporter-like MFS transporter